MQSFETALFPNKYSISKLCIFVLNLFLVSRSVFVYNFSFISKNLSRFIKNKKLDSIFIFNIMLFSNERVYGSYSINSNTASVVFCLKRMLCIAGLVLLTYLACFTQFPLISHNYVGNSLRNILTGRTSQSDVIELGKESLYLYSVALVSQKKVLPSFYH